MAVSDLRSPCLVASILLCLCAFSLAACERPTEKIEPQHALRPAYTKIVAGDEFPRSHASALDYGSEGPDSLIGGMTAATWHEWAVEAWPKACRRIESRLVKGWVRDNRQCNSERRTGIEPEEKMRSVGFLEIAGKVIPVVWTWSRAPEKDPSSCKHDPAPAGSSEYLLTRSSNLRNWQLSTPADSYAASWGIEHDLVWETCGNLQRLLER